MINNKIIKEGIDMNSLNIYALCICNHIAKFFENKKKEWTDMIDIDSTTVAVETSEELKEIL